MLKAIKEIWVAALRSGKYRQSKSNLKYKKVNQEPGHCCLGVLCDLYKQETGNGEWIERPMETSEGQVVNYIFRATDETGFHEAIDYPPPPVLKWAELNEKNPVVQIQNQLFKQSLADLNDSGKYDFNQIADMIEAQH